jgi:hypothetical protein
MPVIQERGVLAAFHSIGVDFDAIHLKLLIVSK